MKRTGSPAYDHRQHAGNQGDVVKHVALIAALQTTLEETQEIPFRYTDAYAGPSGSMLMPGGEWQCGVGRIDRTRSIRSPHVRTWLQWYLPRPALLGTRYPGSALIASDLAADAGKELLLRLWDTSGSVVSELRAFFGKSAVTEGAVCPSARSVVHADFLFVDPPSAASRWNVLLKLLQQGRHLLAWLPVNVAVVDGSTRVSKLAEKQLRAAMDLEGVRATKVLWAQGGRTIGCHLLYRISPRATAAVRQAVAEVVRLSCWSRQEVEHFDEPL